MAYGFGSRLIDNTERKFGHLAIPGLLKWVGGFQFLVFVISAIDPNYGSLIAFDREAIFDGQIWRLFSYLFLPRTSSMMWILFSILFLWFINNGLESAWDSFRVNLYLYAILICLTSLGLISPWGIDIGALLPILVYGNLFFAFASLYPNQEILLMFIIPIKIKYLAWVGAGYAVLISMSSPLIGVIIILGLLPYLAVFGPDFIRDIKHRGKAAQRKSEFQSDTQAPAGEAFHTCSICGIDDIASPEIEFRVTADGDEFCQSCLESKRREEQSDTESESASA